MARVRKTVEKEIKALFVIEGGLKGQIKFLK